MNTLEQVLFRKKDRILSTQNPLKEATEVIYEPIDQRMEVLVSSTKYNYKFLKLFGVIHINGDADIGSFNEIRKFVVIDLKTGISNNCIEKMLS